MVRFGVFVHPTVRFGAVSGNQESYTVRFGAAENCTVRFGAVAVFATGCWANLGSETRKKIGFPYLSPHEYTVQNRRFVRLSCSLQFLPISITLIIAMFHGVIETIIQNI